MISCLSRSIFHQCISALAVGLMTCGSAHAAPDEPINPREFSVPGDVWYSCKYSAGPVLTMTSVDGARQEVPYENTAPRFSAFVYSPGRKSMFSFNKAEKRLVKWNLVSASAQRIAFADTEEPLHFELNRRSLTLTGEMNLKTEGGRVNTRATYSGTCKLVYSAK